MKRLFSRITTFTFNMDVSQQLKALRLKRKMTLKELAYNMKEPKNTGNMSRYENGGRSRHGLRPNDKTVLRILKDGYGMTLKEARQTLAEWRKEEVESKYHLHLAQNSQKYNANQKKSKKEMLSDYLSAEGLDSQAIKKATKEINQIVKKYKN